MELNINWNISDTIRCQQLTEEYLDEALTFIDTTFFPHENVCSTLKLADDPKVLLELRDLTLSAAKDGVTVIAIDLNLNKIVGVALNKIQVSDVDAFDNFAKQWKQPRSQALVTFMSNFDNLCNLFEFCQVDSLLELMFLATSPEYRGKGIAKKLIELSIEIARVLNTGVNIKKSVDNIELSLEPVPKIISAIFTSAITQKMSQKMGFTLVAAQNYKDLMVSDVNFDDVVKRGTEKLTLEYKSL